MLESVLRQTGYRTGLYTSPHLTDMRERIRVSGRLISKRDVARIVERLASAPESAEATYFETLTAMAFIHFAASGADIAVLETGLGGRLDATNVVTPVVSLITGIGLEHTQILGRSLVKIAREKAGIMKPGVPCVAGKAKPGVRKVFEAAAASLGTPLIHAGDAVHISKVRLTDQGSWFDAEGGGYRYPGLYLRLLGRHQVENAAVVLAAVEQLRKKGYEIPEQSIRKGFSAVNWPGRLDLIRRDPLVLLDSAHNPSGMRTLKAALGGIFKYDRLILVFGVLQDKNFNGMLEQIAPLAHRIILSRPNSDRAADPASLASLACLKGKSVEIVPDIKKAWALALRHTRKRDMVCGTGSIYFVGEIMKLEN
jgi:dihydrofolate synthase/folylpolyglutamate synthase